MKQILIAALFIFYTGAAIANDDPADPPAKKERMGNMMQKLKLTDDQKSKVKDIHFATEKQAVELRSKVQMSRIELQQLLSSETPDRDAIEKQIQEVASNEASLKMNRLNAWFEVNKILNPDQQKIWKKMLDRRVAMRGRWNRMRRMRGQNFGRSFRQQGRMMMNGHGMPPHGMPNHQMPDSDQH
jgi:Spy/CpxP family protein refolding chaperone